jgi:hypothetical protein
MESETLLIPTYASLLKKRKKKKKIPLDLPHFLILWAFEDRPGRFSLVPFAGPLSSNTWPNADIRIDGLCLCGLAA